MTLIPSKRMISHWRIRRYKTKTNSQLGKVDNAGDAQRTKLSRRNVIDRIKRIFHRKNELNAYCVSNQTNSDRSYKVPKQIADKIVEN